jgi:hypothetical protein
MMTFSGMTTLELKTTDEAAEPVLYTPQLQLHSHGNGTLIDRLAQLLHALETAP